MSSTVLTPPQYQRLMRTAVQTNARRDRDEQEAGFAAPADSGPRECLRTVQSAIEAGIMTRDWPCVAEGLAMLEDHLQRTYGVRPSWERATPTR